jgi:N-acetylmuramoyl-L-alanine amidase
MLIPVLFYSCKKKNQDGVIKAKNKILLVLDAAHGGLDTGNVSSSGLTEKNMVLAFCNKMSLIAGDYNIEVLLTRKADTTLSGDDRLAMANIPNADVFLSFHINKSTMTKAITGYDVIAATENPKYADSKSLAAAIISKLAAAGPTATYTEKEVYVLKNNLHAALAIECGDIENATDVAALTNADKMEALCRTMLEGIVAYYNSK